MTCLLRMLLTEMHLRTLSSLFLYQKESYGTRNVLFYIPMMLQKRKQCDNTLLFLLKNIQFSGISSCLNVCFLNWNGEKKGKQTSYPQHRVKPNMQCGFPTHVRPMSHHQPASEYLSSMYHEGSDIMESPPAK